MQFAIDESCWYEYGGDDRKGASIVDGKALQEGVDYEVSFPQCVDPGKYAITIRGKGAYTGSVDAPFTVVEKATQRLTVKASSKSIAASKLGKRAVTLRGSISVKGAKGKVAYVNASKSKILKRFKVGKSKGTVKVPKGTVPGIYKVKVKVTAKGDGQYRPRSKTATVKVTVTA